MWSAASRSISAVSPPEPTSTPSVGGDDGDGLVGQRADPAQGAHQRPRPSASPRRSAGPAPGPRSAAGRVGQRLDAVHELLAGRDLAELVEAGDRVAVRRLGGVVEQLDQAALDGLGHHVLPAAGLVVDELPVQADDVGEQPLGEPVLAHHPGGQPHALVGELEVAVALDGEQAVALHPGHGLARRSGRSGAAARRSGHAAGRCPPRPARRWSGGTSRWCRSGRSPAILSHRRYRRRRAGRVERRATRVMWFRRDLRLARQPGPARAPCADGAGAAAVRARPGAVGPGRAVPPAPTSPRRCAPSTPRSGSVTRSVVRGDPVRRGGAGRAARSAPTRVHVAADYGPYGRAPRPRRSSAALGRARHRAGPHRLAVRRRAGPGDQGRRRRRTRSSRRSPRRWADHGWRGPVGRARPARAGWRSTDTDGVPDRGAARRARAARGRRGRRAAALARRSSTTGSTATTDDRDRPDLDGTSHMSVHLKWGEIHPRTMLADLGGRTAQRRARPSARSWPGGSSTPTCCSTGRDTARDYLRPEFARMAYDEPGDAARRVARGAHRLPDRRRRHAPAAGDRLDAQPGPDDRGQLPGQGPAPRVAARRPPLHAAGWSTATSPPTSTAGSGRRAAAPTRRRTSGSSTRSPRAGSSTPTATTSGAGSPSCADRPHDPRDAAAVPDPIVDHAEERREALDRYERIKTMTDLLVARPLLRTADRPATAAGRAGALAALVHGHPADHAEPWPAITRHAAPAAAARHRRCPTTEADGVTTAADDGGAGRPGRASAERRSAEVEAVDAATARAAEASYAGLGHPPVPDLLRVRPRPRARATGCGSSPARSTTSTARPGSRRSGRRTRAPPRTGTRYDDDHRRGVARRSPGPRSTAPAAGPPTSASGRWCSAG